MKLDLNKKVEELLTSKPGHKFTAREIAEWMVEKYPDVVQHKASKSNNKALATVDNQNDVMSIMVAVLVAEIGAHRKAFQKRCPGIKTTEERPRKFYYTTQTDQAEVEEAEEGGVSQDSNKQRYLERDLYPMLSTFLWAEYGIYSKRIDEKRSSNSRGTNGNKWLYPDLVAMEDLTADWDKEITGCVEEHGGQKTHLWSFEVKLLINRSNVREAFFQAVSNSSWANYGYLVAAELEGSDTKRELQILCRLHGIGFILLDPKSPAESQVLIPAGESVEVDWDAANRLIQQNHDFRDFIEEVTSFHKTGRIKLSDWDVEAA